MKVELKTLAWKIERRWMLLPWRWCAGWALQGLGGAACFFGGVMAPRSSICGVLAGIAGLMFFCSGWAVRSAE
jgi:hypothetical protein